MVAATNFFMTSCIEENEADLRYVERKLIILNSTSKELYDVEVNGRFCVDTLHKCGCFTTRVDKSFTNVIISYRYTPSNHSKALHGFKWGYDVPEDGIVHIKFKDENKNK